MGKSDQIKKSVNFHDRLDFDESVLDWKCRDSNGTSSGMRLRENLLHHLVHHFEIIIIHPSKLVGGQEDVQFDDLRKTAARFPSDQSEIFDHLFRLFFH